MTARYEDFKWVNKYELYLGEEKIATLIPKLFLIRWEDNGVESDIYNLARAKDNAIKGQLAHIAKKHTSQSL